MLIGSHILEEGESSEYTNWFVQTAHQLHIDTIAQRLALLLHHDELWATCSYLPATASETL